MRFGSWFLMGALLVGADGCGAFSPKVGALQTADDGDDYGEGGVHLDAGLDAQVSFALDIRPLMDRHKDDPTGPGCRDCHYNTSPSPTGLELTGLDLTTLGSLRKGGENTGTNIVVPGDPDKSDIIQKLRGTFPIGQRMPQSGPPYWTDAQINLVATWIAQGALGADSE